MKKLIKFSSKIINKNNLLNINKIYFNNNIKRFYAKKEAQTGGDQVAVILSGCGYLDGTEITEAVSLIIHLSNHNVNAQFFAPQEQQEETFDHIKKKVESNEVRNILEESTRITRTPVLPLNRLKAENFTCLFLPGGYGVAKNLSNFANVNDMREFAIHKEVENILKEFHEQKKPIGLICIAPVLAAKLFKGCSITLGDDTYKSKMDQLGAHLINTGPEDIVIDKNNRLFSTPAYCLSNAKPNQVYKGVGELVKATLNYSNPSVSVDGQMDPVVEMLLKPLSPEEQKKFREKMMSKKLSTRYTREGAMNYDEKEENERNRIREENKKK